VDRTLAGGRRDHRGGECGHIVEWRKKPGDRSGQQRLTRPGWTHEQQTVSTGQRDLERATGPGLAANLGQVRDAPSDRRRLGRAGCAVAGAGLPQLDPRRRDPSPARPAEPDQLDRFDESLDSEHLDPTYEVRLVDCARGDDHASDPTTSQRRDHGQHPRHRPNFATKRELADQCHPAGTRANLF